MYTKIIQKVKLNSILIPSHHNSVMLYDDNIAKAVTIGGQEVLRKLISAQAKRTV